MNDSTQNIIIKQREMLKAYSLSDIKLEACDESQGFLQPPVVYERKTNTVIPLPQTDNKIMKKVSFWDIINDRISRRKYQEEKLQMEELSFLLWTTQGVRKLVDRKKKATFRTVPSAGSRHPFETYLFINKVEGLTPGLYHYLAMEHSLEYLGERTHQTEELEAAFCGQKFVSNAPVVFVWGVIPYRTEWRYGTKSQRFLLLDAGHVCQNLYLSGESIGCGVCAIGSYDQDLLDELLGFVPGPSADAAYECAIYAAAVGKANLS